MPALLNFAAHIVQIFLHRGFEEAATMCNQKDLAWFETLDLNQPHLAQPNITSVRSTYPGAKRKGEDFETKTKKTRRTELDTADGTPHKAGTGHDGTRVE